MPAAKVFPFTTTGAKFALGYQVSLATIRWVSDPAVAGDKCIIKDGNGNVIYEVEANGPHFIDAQRYDPWPLFNGLTVDTIASGTVYFEIR